YVELKNKSFVPTDVGYEVKSKLDKYFPNIMNIKFTAQMEDELDEVDGGEKNWIDLLKEFYKELQEYEEKCKIALNEELEKIVESDVKSKDGKYYLIMKIGRFGKYLASPDPESKENISLKGINIPMEDIKNGKIFVKEQLDLLNKKKEGQRTDLISETGYPMLLKYGRFGAYLESENYKEDEIRKTIPKEIKDKIEKKNFKEEDGILLIKESFEEIQREEERILKQAGKCEKCGKPFKIGNGRWGKFLACTGYPTCKNIKKIK
ncbi:DNA topoisomerase, partial [Fusobacterium sp.]|uniref:DNA topoisomerase n=1 Tax=Fusobacterium sp. TaxID=68766 RepID=UPI0025B92BA8